MFLESGIPDHNEIEIYRSSRNSNLFQLLDHHRKLLRKLNIIQLFQHFFNILLKCVKNRLFRFLKSDLTFFLLFSSLVLFSRLKIAHKSLFDRHLSPTRTQAVTVSFDSPSFLLFLALQGTYDAGNSPRIIFGWGIMVLGCGGFFWMVFDDGLVKVSWTKSVFSQELEFWRWRVKAQLWKL